MTTPINTFQDILDAMERDPALLDALRRHILTDDLLELPAQVKALTETVETLAETVETLAETFKALSETVAVLTKDVEIIKTDLSSLTEKVSGLAEKVSSLTEKVNGLTEKVNGLRDSHEAMRIDLDRIGGHVSNLLGTDYESTVARYADRLARRHLRLVSPAVTARARGVNATLPLPVGDQAAEAGRISWDEADDLALSDVIVAALTEAGEDVFVVAEISMTVQQKDRENAARRSDILQRATGTPSIPVTIGISQELPALAPAPAFIACDPEQPFAG